MPVPWTTVISVVPWFDVLKAAPEIVKRTRRLLSRTSEPQPAAPAVAAAASDSVALASRVATLEMKLAQAAEQQRLSAELLRSLAEQSDSVVKAVEVLRLHARRLAVLCGLLAAATAGLAVWIFLH